MNILPDGTGWILPPRCAARYTMGLMWRYGLERIAYHGVDIDIAPTRILMNIRNPYSRIRSWLRLWNATMLHQVDPVEYFNNLHTGIHGCKWVDVVEEPNDLEHHWKYPVPLCRYPHIIENEMEVKGQVIEAYVRQEHMEEDLERVGYPIRNYEYQGGTFFRLPESEREVQNFVGSRYLKETAKHWEPGDGQTDLEFYRENPYCAEVVSVYYEQDFEMFGYSKDIEKIKEGGFCNPRLSVPDDQDAIE